MKNYIETKIHQPQHTTAFPNEKKKNGHKMQDTPSC